MCVTTRQVTQAYGASSQSALVQIPASLIASYEGKLLHLSETVKEDSNLRNICSIPPKGSQRFVATEMEPFPMGWSASRRSRALAPGHGGCLHLGVRDVFPTDGGLLVHWLDVLPLAPEQPMLPDSFGLSDAIPGPQKPFLKYLFWRRP